MPRPSGSSSRFGAPFLRRPSTIDALESFEADRLELEDLRDVIGGLERVAVSEADQRPVLRARESA